MKTLAQLRNEHELSQRDLAELLGISHGAVAMYENGSRTPSLKMARIIANLFNISLDELLFSSIVNEM